jgi:hypothetical protein
MHLRELNLEQNASREDNQNLDQSAQNHVDTSKDLEVEGQSELEDPFATCSCQGLRRAASARAKAASEAVSDTYHNDANAQRDNPVELDVNRARELDDDVDACLDVRNNLADNRLAVTPRGVVAIVCKGQHTAKLVRGNEK